MYNFKKSGIGLSFLRVLGLGVGVLGSFCLGTKQKWGLNEWLGSPMEEAHPTSY